MENGGEIINVVVGIDVTSCGIQKLARKIFGRESKPRDLHNYEAAGH